MPAWSEAVTARLRPARARAAQERSLRRHGHRHEDAAHERRATHPSRAGGRSLATHRGDQAFTGDDDLATAMHEGLLSVLLKLAPVPRLLDLIVQARRGGLVLVVDDDVALAENARARRAGSTPSRASRATSSRSVAVKTPMTRPAASTAGIPSPCDSIGIAATSCAGSSGPTRSAASAKMSPTPSRRAAAPAASAGARPARAISSAVEP
jgi:hypothetical protein